MLNTRLATLATSLFATVSYLLCVAFGLLTPQSVHMHQLLELLLPAFQWISVKSFLLGFIESALWGAYLGGGFSLVSNMTRRLFDREGGK